ncbi:hypothetical protein P3S68_020194 [Capsicum galapagoense]
MNLDGVWIPKEISQYFSSDLTLLTILHYGTKKTYKAKVACCRYQNRRRIYDGWRYFIRDASFRIGNVLDIRISYSVPKHVFVTVHLIIDV